MADTKYGRLYTEADISGLLATALSAHGLSGEDTAEAVRKTLDDLAVETTTFHKDEPLFVLRGQDEYALGTIVFYHQICDEAGVSKEHLDAVDASLELFREFRANHPDLIKDPD